MKIYTYYQEIDHANQSELIDLWKLSWSRQGYEPIVLNLQDAKIHPYFETLNTEMRRIFKEITNKEISDYGMSCWFRWLAYAAQADEKFYVSDYDAINVGFPVTEPNDKLHLMDSACPFLASGTPKQFENLCKAFLEVSNERMEILKQQSSHYHDQEFFMYNLTPRHNQNCESLKNQYEILMTRDRSKIGGFYDCISKTIDAGPRLGAIKAQNYYVAHIAHRNVKILMEKYSQFQNFNGGQLRIHVVKNLLGI